MFSAVSLRTPLSKVLKLGAAGEGDEPPEPMMFVVPREQWRRLDDWGAQLGLKGSGSHSVAIEKAHIPARYALPGTHMGQTSVAGGTPGRELHGNPMYGGGVLSSLQFPLASVSVGMAAGALDAREHRLHEESAPGPGLRGRPLPSSG